MVSAASEHKQLDERSAGKKEETQSWESKE
jgi:hypothetical protein